jgi:centromeric protein E
MVIAAMEGYHSSVLAYGQIGSGKSYTMQGNVGEHGIISFALQNVFEFIDTHPEMDFLLRLSYLEIFHEKIYDLLASGAKSDIRIYEFVAEDSDEKDIKDIIIKGAREEIVTSFQHAWSLVKEGNFHRHMGITENNQKSSQSHTILRIVSFSFLYIHIVYTLNGYRTFLLWCR